MKSFLTCIFLCAFVVCTLCQSWQKLPGTFSRVSAKGNEVWAIDSNGLISRLVNTQWQTVSNTVKDGSMNGKPAIIAASQDGWAWVKTDKKSLYRYNVDIKLWESIKVDVDVDRVNAISKDSAIVLRQSTADPSDKDVVLVYKSGTWEKMPQFNQSIYEVAIGENDDRWASALNGIYRWNPSATPAKWENMSDNAFYLDVQNGDRVVIWGPQGDLLMRKGSAWSRVDTQGKKALVATINRDSIYFVDSSFNVYTAKI